MISGAPDFDRTPDAEPDHRERLAYLDALRVTVIAMVIVHHAAQAYGPTGGIWPVEDAAQSDWFRPFYTVNAAVGLGLLFLLAGYFVPGRCDRKGPRRFMAERGARIGVPLVFFTLAVHLPLVYLYESRPALGEFVHSLYTDGWAPVYLHLWFLAHLLLYTGSYLAWRFMAARAGWSAPRWAVPGHLLIGGFAVVLAAATWLVRWWYEVDEWVPLLFLIAAEPAKMPQYVSLFALGVLASRGDWLHRIPLRTGTIWLGVGLAAVAVVVALEVWGFWADPRANGGLTWPSLGRSALEALVCAGLAVGVVVAFRELFRRSSRVLAASAKASYAAYILHVWIVVALQASIAGLALPVLLKFAFVSVSGVALSFGAGYLSRQVPGVRRLLGTTTRATAESAASEGGGSSVGDR